MIVNHYHGCMFIESTSLATGCVRKRKHKESSCELSASRAKKQRLTEGMSI